MIAKIGKGNSFDIFILIVCIGIVSIGVCSFCKKYTNDKERLRQKVELKHAEVPEEPSKGLNKVWASDSPYHDGSSVLTDEGKIKMWNTLERQRETRHDFTQILEAQVLFSNLLTRCDTNVFMLQVVMDGLDSLKKSYERNNRQLIEIDSELIKYRFYLREKVILKE